MFERFTEKAIKVIMLAQEEARRLGHNFIGAEQIFLGLIGEGTGIAAKTFKAMGVNLKDARIEVEKIIGRGLGFVAVEIPFTPQGKEILFKASDISSQECKVNYISTEHILLGLLKTDSGISLIQKLGLEPLTVEKNIIKIIESRYLYIKYPKITYKKMKIRKFESKHIKYSED
jgi:ATP-dependent Clp protease ATP-binding subunit ClpC